jgi:DNA-binding CsgD family transcriptional regulator
MTRSAKRSARRSGSVAKKSPALEVEQWVELLDQLYQSEGEAEELGRWLRSLAERLEADRCDLVWNDSSGRVLASSETAAGEAIEGESFEVDGRSGLSLVVSRRRPLSRSIGSLVGALGAHLARVCHPAPISRLDGALLPAALDRLSLGVIVLGGDGMMLHANLAGHRVLEEGTGIVRTGAGVSLASPEAEASLAELRTTPVGERRSRPATRLVVPREGRQPIEVLAVNLEGMEIEGGSAIALFVSDPEVGGGTPPSILRELYGLSKREADVVEQILLGRPLDEAASALGIHLETVRMHLKQVFQKVGTRRQVDLVRLLLTGVRNLQWE